MRGIIGISQPKYGFLEITASDLIPRILGGHFVKRGFNKSVYFDASETYDPDFPNGIDAFVFYWSCSNRSAPSFKSIKSKSHLQRVGLPVFNETEFCKANSTFFKGGPRINQTTDLMSINVSYTIAVDVFKDVNGLVRHARFVQVMRVVDGDIPHIYIR
jgi:hypothetical protein